MSQDVYEAYKKDFQNGIVSIGNICSANCFFCSQKWNPPGVIRSLNRFLTLEEIKHFVNNYLNTIRWINSGIHTNTGEFFSHPHASQILDFLSTKKKIASGETCIFSNGMDLTQDHIKIIKKTELTLCFSLNSSNINFRKKHMGGSYIQNKNALVSFDLINKNNVSCFVWLVPFRSAISNGDLERTIRNIKKSKIENIMINRPGFTRFTPFDIAKELTIPDHELREFFSIMERKYKIKTEIPGALIATEKIKVILNKLLRLLNNPTYSKTKKKLFLCSESAKDYLPLIFEKTKIKNYDIKAVKSRVFGGNVDCSGLLLVEDYIFAIEEYCEKRQNNPPELIILPSSSFDVNGEDLSMVSYKKIKEKYKVEVILV